MSNKSIFIKNKKRALLDALGRTKVWVPEHERLNVSPVMPVDVSEDFMNEKRRRPLGSRKPPVSAVEPTTYVTETNNKTRAVNLSHHDQAWLPQQKPAKDYSHGDINYDDVPEQPQSPFEHTHKALGVDLSKVLPDQYCLIYANEVWPADSVDVIEEAIEQIMRSDPNVQDEDIIVIKRLSIKVGVSISK